MIDERIIREEDFDQVLFLGEHTIRLGEFRMLYPSEFKGYLNIVWGDPYFAGLMKREVRTVSIDEKRVLLRQPVAINGKRTLLVMADINSIDNNKSFLDMAMADKDRDIEALNVRSRYISSENMLLVQFINEKHLESSWEEWLQNKLELIRVASIKVGGRSVEMPEATMTIKPPEDKK